LRARATTKIDCQVTGDSPALWTQRQEKQSHLL